MFLSRHSLKKGFPKNYVTRSLIYMIGDAVARGLAFWATTRIVPVSPLVFFLYLPFKTYGALVFRTHALPWRLFSMVDALRVGVAEGVGSMTGALAWYLARGGDPSFVVLEALFSIVFVEMFRMSRRVFEETLRPRPEGSKRPMIIYGAGFGGESVIRDLQRDGRFQPVAILDDDPTKWGTTLHGIPVVGGRSWLTRMHREGVRTLLIAIPSAPAEVIQKIWEEALKAGYTDIRALPDFYEWFHNPSAPSIRPIQMEDLLRRPPVPLNEEGMEQLLKNKRIWVTGAAGTIGSELAEVIARFSPKELVLIDINESDLYLLKDRLRSTPTRIVLADIRDFVALQQAFQQARPDGIFHAAALKHVPLVEAFPREGVWTNVLGTLYLVRLARRFQVPHFVLISTDKAVNPTSVMGATKRLAERVVTGMGYTAVRFGNVLGSRGSVIPLFEQQLARGGPLTVTHPDMRRYFMAPKEAILLVLQAAILGKGEGEVFVLDMGDPVSIVELAKTFLRLKGYEPDRDIPIVFTGPRPGEKLHEELLQAEEGVEPTSHPKVFRARLKERLDEAACAELEREIMDHLNETTPDFWRNFLRRWVPTYQPHPYEVDNRREKPYKTA